MTSSSDEKDEATEAVCEPCASSPADSEPEACRHFQDYLSPEEERVLRVLREIKEQARDLRGKIRGLDHLIDRDLLDKPEEGLTQQERERRRAQERLREEWLDCSQRLEELRAEWKEMEARREAAHHRKMVLLGHRPWNE